jgi:Zinc carboxypeptidase
LTKRAAVAALAATAVSAAPASAAELLSSSVATGDPITRSCDRELSGGRGYVSRKVAAPGSGWVTARLHGGGGDWDLSVLDSAGRVVAASSHFGASEVAEGPVFGAQQLSVQACRLSGSSRRADLDVEFEPVSTDAKPQKMSLVEVSTPTRERKNALTSLGLDVTEHGGKDFIAVVLHGPRDAEALRRNGFSYKVEVPDLAKQDARSEELTARFSQRVGKSALPTGRTSYRQLNDYSEDMKRLVRENPDLVRPFTLPHRTHEGRPVEGIEITSNVHNLNDGKPVYAQMGLHHAREWPSGEHTIEWAFDLVNGYKSGEARTRHLVNNVRTLVIPVVNPDGFNISRVAGSAAPNQGGRGAPNPGETNENNNVLTHPNEYRRKNCRSLQGEAHSCAQPAAGLASSGVDPNRNYGTFWGGPGASPDPISEIHFGPGPFSEPETQNIKDLVSRRQVTVLITNHTFSNLVLRPPGVQLLGNAPDEQMLKSLGDSMAAENGYMSIYGWQLYDTTGTTEDWSYNSTGGLGYTFEIGCVNANFQANTCTQGHFHPPYNEMVKEYEGTTAYSNRVKDGGGNREAYFKAMEAALDTSTHSLLAGRDPGGVVLRIRKQFDTPTMADRNGDQQLDTFRDELESLYETPGGGNIAFHMNPSTRPLVAETRGRNPEGPPQPKFESGDNPPPPVPCPEWHSGGPFQQPACYRDHAFVVQGRPYDNGFLVPEVRWRSPASDYLFQVRRDVNGDGDYDDEGELVVQVDSPLTTLPYETTVIGDPPPGNYVLRVINFAAAEPYSYKIDFRNPILFQKQVEAWNMTCETFGGEILTRTNLIVGRGQRTNNGLAECAAELARRFRSGRNCNPATGRVRGATLDRLKLGSNRRRNLRRYRIARRGKKNLDRFCIRERVRVRRGKGKRRRTRVVTRGRLIGVGYPARTHTRGLGRRKARRVRDKAIVLLTNSVRFRIRKIRVGTKMTRRVIRRRLGRRVQSFRIGKNRWYVARGKKARLVFRVRRGRVRELGLGAKGFTGRAKKTKRFLRGFPAR